MNKHIGLSFGGMIAMEIAKIIDVRQLVLLASAKGHKELPLIMEFEEA